MDFPRSISTRRVLRGLAMFLVLTIWLPTHAAEIPWEGKRLSLVANDEPLDSFLKRLFAQLGVPVRTSEQVTGRVSGRFMEDASVLFSELADSYGFTWYFDGSAVFVSSISESESKLYQLKPDSADRFIGLVEALGIQDPRFEILAVPEEGYASASGPPRFLERIDEVIGFLKSAPVAKAPATVPQNARTVVNTRRPATPGRPAQAVKVFKLQHAWAADRTVSVGGTRTIITGVARLVAGTMGQFDSRKSPALNIQRVLPVSGQGLLGQGMRTIGRTDGYRQGQGVGEETAPSFNPPAIRVRQSQPQVANNSASSSGNVYASPDGVGQVQADTRLNAVIVRDSLEKMPLYEELIRSLDQPVPLVEIEATVVDIRSDSAEALGVDFSLLLSNRPGRTNTPLLSIDPQSVQANVAPRAEVVVGSEKNFLYARIDALRQSGDATVQSQPRVLTVDNSEAVISSSQEFFVRVAGAEVVDLFNVNVGLTLRVTPSIVVVDGITRFKLQVRIEDGSIEEVSVVDGIPVVNRSSISANVIVDEGESLFIGGLSSERSANSERAVPGLGGIPVLGRLFRSNASESRKFQRMFLLTPKLVKGVL